MSITLSKASCERTHYDIIDTMTGQVDLNEEELAILAREESTSAYETEHVEGISIGRQSRVSVLKFKFPAHDELIVWKRMGAGKGLTEAEAKSFYDTLRPYRRSLRDYGWNVPKLFHFNTEQVGSEYQISSFEQYISGGDADHDMSSSRVPNYRKWFILRTVLETLAEYPATSLRPTELCGRQLTALPHGLDLKLANIVAEEHQVWFVDLFGPKLLNEDGSWQTYTDKLDGLPSDSLRAVTATREGAILRLIRLAEPSWLASGSIERGALRSNLLDALEQAAIPPEEINFIMSEVEGDYPWLSTLYNESQV